MPSYHQRHAVVQCQCLLLSEDVTTGQQALLSVCGQCPACVEKPENYDKAEGKPTSLVSRRTPHKAGHNNGVSGWARYLHWVCGVAKGGIVWDNHVVLLHSLVEDLGFWSRGSKPGLPLQARFHLLDPRAAVRTTRYVNSCCGNYPGHTVHPAFAYARQTMLPQVHLVCGCEATHDDKDYITPKVARDTVYAIARGAVPPIAAEGAQAEVDAGAQLPAGATAGPGGPSARRRRVSAGGSGNDASDEGSAQRGRSTNRGRSTGGAGLGAKPTLPTSGQASRSQSPAPGKRSRGSAEDPADPAGMLNSCR